MSVKTTLAVTALSIFAAGSVFAVEASRDFEHQTLSTKTRADVVAELRAAQRDGALGSNEGSPIQPAHSTSARRQVVAETREAQRLGLIANGEHLPFATAAQADQVRLAGERALATSVAATR